jgi:epoxyqueuosine reductase
LTALTRNLKRRAFELGFDQCRVTRPDQAEKASQQLAQWLAEGRHGQMHWMATTAERRSDPRALWTDVGSIVMLAVNYGPADDPLATLARRSHGNIAAYSRNVDYHDLMKGRLKLLAGWLVSQSRAVGVDLGVKVFVDTAPVMEKPLAQAAGIGWQGKHTNLVSRQFGSWLLLGSLFTTLALDADAAEKDHCGTCRSCLDVCPTNAFPAPYQLDARRCISYLTIEHKGPIPMEFRASIGNRIFGCDDCLAICPWNRFAQQAREAKLQARSDRIAPLLATLVQLTEPAFRAHFSRSPIKRIGYACFLRNVLIAIGNSGDESLREDVVKRLHDRSALVRGAAVWAASRLWRRDAFSDLARGYAETEADPAVAAEWSWAKAQLT